MYLELDRKKKTNKKTVEHECDRYINYNWCVRNIFPKH